jgi:hypothetical protein
MMMWKKIVSERRTLLLILCLAALVLILPQTGLSDTFETWLTPHDLKNSAEGIGTNTSTIFVSVASYRDDQCARTVRDLFSKARYPSRVFVGVVEQNKRGHEAEESCTGSTPDQLNKTQYMKKNIRRLSIPHSEAKGPCYARYLASTLYRGEHVYMQIDSHTTMVDDWDTKVIEEIQACPNPGKAIISMYPNDDKSYSTASKDIPVMCGAEFNQSGIPIFKAAMKPPTYVGTRPRPNAFMAGGFFAAPGRFVREVPYDPGLLHLFAGEEILLSARAYTHGYDIYTPRQNICLHFYMREDRPKFWNDIDRSSYDTMKKQSESRARRILGLEEPVIEPGTDAYGLGVRRHINEYWNHAGINPKTKETNTQQFCG